MSSHGPLDWHDGHAWPFIRCSLPLSFIVYGPRTYEQCVHVYLHALSCGKTCERRVITPELANTIGRVLSEADGGSKPPPLLYMASDVLEGRLRRHACVKSPG